MKTLGYIFLFLIAVVFAFCVALLQTYVILDVSRLFDLKFITENLTYLQIYGTIGIINLIKFKVSKKESDNTIDAAFGKMFGNVFTSAIYCLLSWGFLYLAYSIIN